MATTQRSNLEILIRSVLEGKGFEETQKGFKKTDEGAKDLRGNLEVSLGVIKEVGFAAGVMGAAFKTAWELAKGGAAILTTRDQLDKLAVSIGTTSDAITTQLGEAMSGLMTNADIVTSATELISLGLAKDEDSVVRLASVVGKLGWDMQQVILTFANNSKARLDALGLSVTDVNERMRRFQERGFSMDEAFDMAVLEAGEAKIELLGDQADSAAAPFQRLEVKVTNVLDTTKEWLAEGILPILELLPGGKLNITDAVDDHEKQVKETAETYEEYRDEIMRTYREQNRLVDQWVDAGISLEEQAVNLGMATRAQFEFGESNLKGAKDSKAAAEALRSKAEIIAEVTLLTATAQAEELALHDDRKRSMASLENYNEILDEHATHLEEAAKVEREWRESMAGVAQAAYTEQVDLIEELIDAQGDLEAAGGEWVSWQRDNSEQVSEISSQLAADLTGDQRAAYQDILSTATEGGAEWLGAYSTLQGDLTDAQRAGLVAREADLAGASGQWLTTYTGDADAAEGAQQRIEAANAAMLQSYKEKAFAGIFYSQLEQGTFSEDMAATAVSLGLMGEQQAEMMVEASRVSGLLEEAMTDFRDEMDEMDPTQLNTFIELIASGETDSITGAMIQATSVAQTELIPALTGENGLVPSLEALGEPMVGFSNTVATETPTITGHLDDVDQRLENILLKLDDLSTRQITIDVGLGGAGADALTENLRERGME